MTTSERNAIATHVVHEREFWFQLWLTCQLAKNAENRKTQNGTKCQNGK
jgi:hypothetical protein